MILAITYYLWTLSCKNEGEVHGFLAVMFFFSFLFALIQDINLCYLWFK